MEAAKEAIPGHLRPFKALGGLTLYAPSPADAQAEAHANEEGQVYFGRGAVTLQEGDVVLDLGANVGAFSRIAAPVVGRSGAIYAVEPIPALAQALELNARLFADWAAARGAPAGRVVAVQAGVGALGGPREAVFTYYPKITAFTSMYRDDEDAAAATLSLVVNRRESFSLAEDAGKLLARCAPALYRAVHTRAFIALLMRPAAPVTCPMTTVSAIIEERGITEVALLKANVERAEWDVLLGVEDRHWPRIRQVSLQVHDIKGRVAAVEALLRAKGFARVTVFKEPRFRDCNLFMVYGARARR